MPSPRASRCRIVLALAACIGACAAINDAQAATETPIAVFTTSGGAGYDPIGGVIIDSAIPPTIVPAGTLFGTTSKGGAYSGVNGLGGSVFELTPPATGSTWKQVVLHHFDARSGSRDGFQPTADLIADAKGNLFGTTFSGGGSPGYGTVFELSPPAVVGGHWTYVVLHRFISSDGANPYSALTLDPSGNGVLYGTTSAGGTSNNGTVFSLTPPGVAGNTGRAWKQVVLHQFSTDGANPMGAVVFDAKGDLFGTTAMGGAANKGTVFELIPPAINGLSHWSKVLIHTFRGIGNDRDGNQPLGRLVISYNGFPDGVLYGTTVFGGLYNNGGMAYLIALPPPQGGTFGFENIHSFNNEIDGDAWEPKAGLLLDPASGTLYGTTFYANNGAPVSHICNPTTGSACGTVFELTTSSEKVLWYFGDQNVSDGNLPYADLNFGLNGNLYGTTSAAGGTSGTGAGTVFKLTLP